MTNKLEIELRLKVTASMFSRMHLLMMAKDYTQSELVRQALREFLDNHRTTIDSAFLAHSETDD